MRNINTKNGFYLIVSISIALFFMVAYVSNISEYNLKNIFKIVPTVVTIDVFLFVIFSKYLWSLKYFRNWLIRFPNLNGTWEGTIQSNWIDPEKETPSPPIPATITIKQSLFTISCVMRTAEMTSHSIVGDFYLDEERQIKKLYYSYESNPKQTVRDRSPKHSGTMVFDIIEEPQKKLTGCYWTDRKTSGEISMDFWKKERLDYFPGDVFDSNSGINAGKNQD